jgi:plastocyanin
MIIRLSRMKQMLQTRIVHSLKWVGQVGNLSYPFSFFPEENMRRKIFLRLFLMGLLLSCSIATLPDRTLQSDVSAQSNNQINITNSKFEPKKLTVTEGTTVTWNNSEGVHTVKSDTNAFVSTTLSSGDKFTYQFTKAGTYPYHCTFHGSKEGHGMAGTIVVKKK